MDGVDEDITVNCKINIGESGSAEPAKIIQQGLIEFNKPWFGSQVLEPFCIYMEDDKGIVIAGISGDVALEGFFAYLHVVWVDEKHRRQGLGWQLFEKLEEHVREKHCKSILLDTYEFQGYAFYKKLGYECIGTIPKMTEGQDKHFMRKML